MKKIHFLLVVVFGLFLTVGLSDSSVTKETISHQCSIQGDFDLLIADHSSDLEVGGIDLSHPYLGKAEPGRIFSVEKLIEGFPARNKAPPDGICVKNQSIKYKESQI